MVNPSNRIEERAAHYSFNVKSTLFGQLPANLRYEWKREIEQAYIAGAKDMIDKPTGGGLLHVCAKSSARGRRDAIDDAIRYIREHVNDFGNNFENDEVCKLLMKEIEKFRELK